MVFPTRSEGNYLTILAILPINLNKDGSTEHSDNLFLEISGDTVGDEPEGFPDC